MPAKGSRSGVLTTCDYCGKPIYLYPCWLKKFKFHYCNAECKKKGYRHNEETREKLVESHLGQKSWNKGLTRQDDLRVAKCGNRKLGGERKVSHWAKGLTKETDPRVRRNSENNIGKHSHRRGISFEEEYGEERAKEMKEILRQVRLKQFFPKISSMELKIRDELEKMDYKFEAQYPFEITLIDIAFPEKKVAIYCDGDYWHKLPGYKERDERCNKFLEERGWKVLRFWEHEIKGDLEGCMKRIEEVITIGE